MLAPWRLFSNPVPVIGAIMKREERYVVEWVAWHKLQGFDLIVGDNCDRGPQTDLLLELQEIGCLTYVDCRDLPKPPQLAANRRMLWHAFRMGYRHIGFLDADEFFEPLTEDGARGADVLRSVLERKGVKACLVRWAIFGSDSQEAYAPEPVMLRFTRRAAFGEKINIVGKPFARISALLFSRPSFRRSGIVLFGIKGVHHFQIARRNFMTDGVRGLTYRPGDEAGDWKCARIRHYAVKSREECRAKASRGDALFPENKYQDDGYWKEHDLNEVSDPLTKNDARALTGKIREIEEALADLRRSR